MRSAVAVSTFVAVLATGCTPPPRVQPVPAPGPRDRASQLLRQMIASLHAPFTDDAVLVSIAGGNPVADTEDHLLDGAALVSLDADGTADAVWFAADLVKAGGHLNASGLATADHGWKIVAAVIAPLARRSGDERW